MPLGAGVGVCALRALERLMSYDDEIVVSILWFEKQLGTSLQSSCGFSKLRKSGEFFF